MARRLNEIKRTHHNVAAGVVTGLVGGLVGTWAMTQFQTLCSASNIDGATRGGDHPQARSAPKSPNEQNANERAADAVARNTINRPLTREELESAAPFVHYGFGAAMGALYGGLREVSAGVRALGGSGWCTILWAGADEVAVPLFGLSRPSSDYPLATHAQAYAAHLVYGLTTELVRRGVRALV